MRMLRKACKGYGLLGQGVLMKVDNKDKFRDGFDFALKIELAGVICSALCLLARVFLFPGTVNPLVTLVPLGLSVMLGAGKSVLIQLPEDGEDEEELLEEYEKTLDEYNKTHRAVKRIVGFGIYIELVSAVLMAVCRV